MKYKMQLAAILATTVITASCGTKEEKKPEAKATTPTYATMQLQPRRISGDVQLPGVMQPFQLVQIYPRISGFVKTVNVDRGSVVKQGQVLMTLDAPEIIQQVAAARLKYTEAEAAYITSKDRYHRLLETSHTPGTVSPYDLEAAASKMQGDSATTQGEYANYKAQQAMGAYLTITAPFDGVITERNVHPGARLDLVIAVDEAQLQALRELAPDGGLAGTHHADEEDVVFAMHAAIVASGRAKPAAAGFRPTAGLS